MEKQIVPSPKARYGNDRERVKRIPFGLGDAPSQDALNKTMRCSFGNVPVVEEVVWTIPLPLTEAEARSTFGDQIKPLASSALGSGVVPGVASIDSTFLGNGVLQTDLYLMGLGLHVFCEPMQLATIGNAWTAPATPAVPPPSPDVFTLNDVANGALGLPQGTTMVPADFDWGGEVWRAGWNFINAYTFQFITSQREYVINELAADVSYFGSYADAEAAGTSEFPIAELVAQANAIYRAKQGGFTFLPTNFRRVGSITTGGNNVGIFHPTRDFDLAPVTWGGLRWQGYGCKGQMYRMIENPCYLERAIPIAMQFQVVDPVHQAAMLEALTIDNSALGTNITPDVNVTCTNTITGANVMLEQTLDSPPVNTPQQVTLCRQVFKGGILKIGIKLKGWEFPAPWRLWCQANAPQLCTGPGPG